LVRVPACHAGGRGFEPRPPRQILKIPAFAGIFLRVRNERRKRAVFSFSDDVH